MRRSWRGDGMNLQNSNTEEMEYRKLNGSGLHVPALTLGTGTFGGTYGFEGWGHAGVEQATRMVDICLEAGLNMFDTADIYSRGLSEEILGKAIAGKRNRVLLSTKATFPMSDTDRNAEGSSRYHIIRACEASLKRLGTDHIDLYYMHGFDANTPVEETLRALDDLVTSGKVGYIGCSNFSGWQLMKSLSVSERYGWHRYVAHQVYYSLLNRDFVRFQQGGDFGDKRCEFQPCVDICLAFAELYGGERGQIVPSALHEPLVSIGFFHGCHIFTLEILGDGDFLGFLIGKVGDYGRDFLHTDNRCSTVSALTEHKFIAVAVCSRTHGNRL